MENTIFDVAVVIPTLNEELYIENCLNTIHSQTFPFEKMDVMVVDGGSTDLTREIVLKLSEKWPNIRLLHNPGKIQSIAFNIGVVNSSAPFVVRLDAHVEYDERYIELCIKHLKEDEELGDVGGVCLSSVRRKGLIPETNQIICQSKFGIGGASFRVGHSSGYVDTVPFGAFPRKMIEKIGGMREDLPRAEDNEYTTRIRKAGYKIYLDSNIISTYYVRDTFYGLLKQMYANGVSIGHLLYVDKSAIGLRHFVPFVFVFSIIISAIGAIFWKPFLWLLLFILASYFTCNLIATLVLCCKKGWKFIVILPALFFCVHCAYGWGTLVGLYKYAKQYNK